MGERPIQSYSILFENSTLILINIAVIWIKFQFVLEIFKIPWWIMISTIFSNHSTHDQNPLLKIFFNSIGYKIYNQCWITNKNKTPWIRLRNFTRKKSSFSAVTLDLNEGNLIFAWNFAQHMSKYEHWNFFQNFTALYPFFWKTIEWLN